MATTITLQPGEQITIVAASAVTPPDPPQPPIPPITGYRQTLTMPMTFPDKGGANNRQYTNQYGGLRTDDLLVIPFSAPDMANLLEIDSTADGTANIPFEWAMSKTAGSFDNPVAGGTAGQVAYRFATNPASQYVRTRDKFAAGQYYFNLRFPPTPNPASDPSNLVVIFIRPNV